MTDIATRKAIRLLESLGEPREEIAQTFGLSVEQVDHIVVGRAPLTERRAPRQKQRPRRVDLIETEEANRTLRLRSLPEILLRLRGGDKVRAIADALKMKPAHVYRALAENGYSPKTFKRMSKAALAEHRAELENRSRRTALAKMEETLRASPSKVQLASGARLVTEAAKAEKKRKAAVARAASEVTTAEKQRKVAEARLAAAQDMLERVKRGESLEKRNLAVIADLRNGESVAEVCNKYGLSESNVRTKARKAGIQFRTHKRERTDEIVERVIDGANVSELAAEFGISRQAIYLMIDKPYVRDQREAYMAEMGDALKADKSRRDESALNAYVAGVSVENVATSHDLSAKSVLTIIKKAYTKKRDAEIVAKLIDGARVDVLSRHYDLSVSEIYRIGRRQGLYRRGSRNNA